MSTSKTATATAPATRKHRGRKPGSKNKSHHKQQPAAQTASTTTAATEPTATAQAATARNGKLPAPRPIPNGALLDDANRLRGIVAEQQRLLAIAEANYERHLGRISENMRLDPAFDWQLSTNYMIPSERSVSQGLTMTAGQSR